MAANPFAPPVPTEARIPAVTDFSLWRMRSRFAVGPSTVEVETAHWTGWEVYRVDGEEVARTRNLGWHARQELDVGRHSVVVETRWYPLFPVTVDVDGYRAIDDLFPQVRRLVGVLGLVSITIGSVLAASTLYDLARWLAAP